MIEDGRIVEWRRVGAGGEEAPSSSVSLEPPQGGPDHGTDYVRILLRHHLRQPGGFEG